MIFYLLFFYPDTSILFLLVPCIKSVPEITLYHTMNSGTLFNDRHNPMIKTRKQIPLTALSFLIFCLNTTIYSQQQFDVTLPVEEKKSHNKRMRKPSIKKPKTKKIRTYMDMNYDQLLTAKDVQKANNNIPIAIKYLDQLMRMCSDITTLADHLLELADLLFLDNQFQKATHIYLQYCALYPGSEKQEYALYRAIASSFACILSVDRDQTKTEETVTLAEQFLQQEHFTVYKNEVLTIQTQCYEQLAASECNICNFYTTRGKFAAAEKRLKNIRSKWLPKLPTLEQQITMLETHIMEQREKAIALSTKNIKVANNKKTKHMADRF
jgi:outer membrane assembly lipoprotein YfiO